MATKEKPKTDLSAIVEPDRVGQMQEYFADAEKTVEAGKRKIAELQGVIPAQATVERAATVPAAVASARDARFDCVMIGKEFSPPKILMYGIDGIGKSSFAAQAPAPIFVQTEEGLKQIGAPRFPLSTTVGDVLAKLDLLATAKHDYQTVVIDGMSGLEKLIYEKVAEQNGKPNIDLVGGGFDKGQKLAVSDWAEVAGRLDRCVARGMAAILIAHARSERMGDPENPMAEQYAPALHRKTSGEMFRRWADATLFLTRRMAIKKEGQGIMEKAIPIPIGADGGERVMRTAWTPGSVAKNRYGMPLEIPFPREGSWNLVMSYISNFYKG